MLETAGMVDLTLFPEKRYALALLHNHYAYINAVANTIMPVAMKCIFSHDKLFMTET
jgi:hypothetical protein